jgi:hypothetical protein
MSQSIYKKCLKWQGKIILLFVAIDNKDCCLYDLFVLMCYKEIPPAG